MSWPHNKDGTVDWETVFEAPDVGLVPYVKRAKTPEALGLCAHLIVHSLFIREQDGVYRKAFNTMIDELIQSAEAADGERIHELVLKLVHEIKANRIKHAARYLEDGGTPEGEHYDRADHDPTEALQALSETDA